MILLPPVSIAAYSSLSTTHLYKTVTFPYLNDSYEGRNCVGLKTHLLYSAAELNVGQCNCLVTYLLLVFSH